MNLSELPKKSYKLRKYLQNHKKLIMLNAELETKQDIEEIKQEPNSTFNALILLNLLEKQVDQFRNMLFEFEERLIAMEEKVNA